MRYVKQAVFTLPNGEPLRMTVEAGQGALNGSYKAIDARTQDLLLYVLSEYVPLPHESLNYVEQVKLNKAIFVLEEQREIGTYYELEDDRAELLIKVLKWTLPKLSIYALRRWSEEICALVEKAPTELAKTDV